jgi:uncharacterized protein YndB with AHSA1/START domain
MAKLTSLVRQDLRWTDSAPIALVGRATTTATPADVFAELADHERWPEWFPNVKKVDVLGPATGVGARRRVAIPGAVVEEEFIAWEPGARWAFTGTAAKPGFVRSIVEDCHLIPIGDGGTAITYTMYLEPTAWSRPLLAVAKRGVQKGLQQAMENLATRAATRSS